MKTQPLNYSSAALIEPRDKERVTLFTMAALWPPTTGAATNPFTSVEVTACPGGVGDSNPTTN